ncbi:Bug family tripartite tricarboxylate transporter substrate binding protein [Falsiroseomonas stagni]|uniref:Tripartite-type tricarboxylate transporter, receptor component TctC n=1 Tax=Falsiroseomonas stagni DSM 19981 TaxID=1123062 RepID=A0A1I4DQG6_9PROT|nr:tripartite tricarboxylate transporter substrate binding protein [Falsiroseomonas stagni]SFK94276.1 Tripartite-type tricarboxylate transporter, receptor component TctC [Falsiroseomonas stagni DSM 19981]
MRITRRAMAGLLPAVAITSGASAQAAWQPARPMRLLVGFPPGGAADLLARRLADSLTQALGQTVVVENRPGAGAQLALDAAAKAQPDGLTISLSPMGPLAVNPALTPGRLPYNAAEDFTPLIHVWDQPNVIVAGMDVPQAWPAFVEWLRRRPEEPYASVGPGSSNHLTGALMSRALGLNLQHITYRGSAAALTAIMGGEIKLFVDNVTTTIPLARDGRVRAIAVTTATRSAALPDVPTFAELGLPELTVSSWQVVVGPKGLPPAVVARLNGELNRAIRTPEAVAWMRSLGAEPVGGTAEQAATMLRTERERWARLIPGMGITVD